MNKHRSLNLSIDTSSLEHPLDTAEAGKTASKRRTNPWHWLGWLRKKMNRRANREFYSLAEKQNHQHARLAQRVANHHHGFKF